MHRSSLALRPRQRTSTSCTECKRRKQKCNQAKDRPCNNCARRYPPVACTYEGSSRGSTIEQVIDLQEGSSSRAEDPPSGSGPTTYQPPSTDYASKANDTTYTSQEHQLPATSHPFYAPLDTTTDDWQQQDDPWSSQNLTSSASSSSVAGGYYQSHDDYGYDSYPSYTTAPQGYGGYYSSAEAPAGGWLSSTGDPSAFVGTGTAYDTLNDLPIDASRRNAELFHFFHQSLAPFLVTIDGKDPPAAFYGEWTPWIVQSPLMSSVTILSASCYQSEIRGLDVAKCLETITIQGKIISVINQHLRKKKLKKVGYEAIGAVMYLAINEWYFGDDGSFWAHLKGMKEMLRLQGGIEKMSENSLLRKQITITDYQIACSFERDLFLLKDTALDSDTMALDAYPTFLETPLLQSEIRFIDFCSALEISRASAEILDDMKFLTTSILNIRAMNPTPQDLLKFQATVLWAHNRISALHSSPPDPIYETLRLTALLYSAAILSRQPLSASSNAAQVQELGQTMWRVSLTHWKKIPGILLWCILVACPCPTENKLQKKYLKMIIATVAMFIGVENHVVAVACMRSFLGVQRWIEGAEEGPEVEITEAEGEFEGKGKGRLIMSGFSSRSASRSARGSVAEAASREELESIESAVLRLGGESAD